MLGRCYGAAGKVAGRGVGPLPGTGHMSLRLPAGGNTGRTAVGRFNGSRGAAGDVPEAVAGSLAGSSAGAEACRIITDNHHLAVRRFSKLQSCLNAGPAQIGFRYRRRHDLLEIADADRLDFLPLALQFLALHAEAKFLDQFSLGEFPFDRGLQSSCDASTRRDVALRPTGAGAFAEFGEGTRRNRSADALHQALIVGDIDFRQQHRA